MRRILAQIFFLAIIKTSRTHDGEGLPNLEGLQKWTPLAEYSDLDPRHDGSGSETDITHKLISEYANPGSFLEDIKQEDSQTISKQENPFQKNNKRIRRAIFGGGYFRFCLFGSCKPEQKTENNNDKRGFIGNTFTKVLCLFNNCDENKKFKHCPKICEIPKDRSTADRCKDIGCGGEREYQKEGSTGNTPKPPVLVKDIPKLPFPVEDTPKPAFPVEDIPKLPFPVENTPKQPFPVEDIPKPPFPVEDTPKPAFPVEDIPKLPFPVENTPKQPFPVEDIPKPPFPVESAPQPKVPEESSLQNPVLPERVCPKSCKKATDESAVNICREIGCEPKPKQKYLVFINNTFENSYPEHCPESCKSPTDNATVQSCQEAGCIHKVLYIKLPNMNDEAALGNICNEWCTPPPNDVVLKTCKAIGCKTEIAKEEISNPEESTNRTTATYCPDSCKSPKDDLIALLCQAIDCKTSEM